MNALERLDDLLFTPPDVNRQMALLRAHYPWALEPARANPLPSLTNYLEAHSDLLGGLIEGHDTVMSWTRGMRGVRAPVRRKT